MCETYCRLQLLYHLKQKKLSEQNKSIIFTDRVKHQKPKIQGYSSISGGEAQENYFPMILKHQKIEDDQLIKNIIRNRFFPTNFVKKSKQKKRNSYSVTYDRVEQNKPDIQFIRKTDQNKKIVVFSSRQNPQLLRKRDTVSSQSRRSCDYFVY